jgi:hypothetical protein
MSVPANSAVGTTGAPIRLPLQTPVVVEGGRYIHIILRIPVGLSTNQQNFRGSVSLNGFFE